MDRQAHLKQPSYASGAAQSSADSLFTLFGAARENSALAGHGGASLSFDLLDASGSIKSVRTGGWQWGLQQLIATPQLCRCIFWLPEEGPRPDLSQPLLKSG